ncbi:chitobiase/beta-hexosaminidase C-terminal domain-containing protein [Arcticibacter sp. MXS-1]|uniref:chitobiase/beta-hexosaminidase C-terminal domain-containing protein n=1 Tax=Arcticibacter sp. MXS-1 TaxID=3341726 RepID=UPI0035A96E4B
MVGLSCCTGDQRVTATGLSGRGISLSYSSPGAIVRNKTVTANVQIPGMQIRYTTDGSEPTLKSPLYTKPFSARGTVILRTFGPSGRAGNSVRLKL